MKLRLRVLLIGMMAAVLIAVGSMAQEPVQLEFWFGENSATYQQAMAGIVADFNAANPHIHVNMTTWNANDVDRLITAIVSGSPPDVAYLAGFTVNVWKVMGGYLQPLNDLMEPEDLRRLDMLPGPMEENARLGTWYAIPFRTTSGGLFMNMDIFENAGFDPNVGPRDIHELDDFAAKLTIRSGDGTIERLGFAPSGNNFAAEMPWLWAFGGELYDEASAMPAFVGNPKNMEALEWILSYADQYGPEASASRGNFLNGRTAMHVNTSTQLATLPEANPDLRWTTSPLPTVPGVESFSIGFSLGSGIPIGARHPQEAIQFILHLSKPETQVRFFEETSSLPAQFQAVREIVPTIADQRTRTLVELLQTSRAMPPFYFPELFNAWSGALNRMRVREITPEQVLEDVQRVMEPVYREAFAQGSAQGR